MTRQRDHLRDDRLIGWYFAERRGDDVDRPAAEHLRRCEDCRARLLEIASFLEGLREKALAEADAVFTSPRLHAQRRAILRRLHGAGQPARVISFPRPAVGAPVASPNRRAPRWVAAGVAVGVFVGAALGASYQLEWRGRPFRPAPGRRGPALLQPASLVVPRPGTLGVRAIADLAADDAFLSELAVAAEGPHSRELLPFDALTPHGREVVDIR